MINKISVTTGLTNQNTFKGKKNLGALTSIPNLTCACCGHKVINPMSLAKAYSDISLPLLTMVKKGYLDNWKKFKNLWRCINNTAYEDPDASLSEIFLSKNMYNYFKQKLLKDLRYHKLSDDYDDVKNIMQSIAASGRIELQPSGVVMERLSEFKPYLYGAPLSAFEKIDYYSQKYPDKKLAEILDTNSIYKHHRKKWNSQKKRF